MHPSLKIVILVLIGVLVGYLFRYSQEVRQQEVNITGTDTLPTFDQTEVSNQSINVRSSKSELIKQEDIKLSETDTAEFHSDEEEFTSSQAKSTEDGPHEKRYRSRHRIDQNPERGVGPEDYDSTTISGEWAETHVDKVYEIVNNMASTSTAWGMRDMIGGESQFMLPREKQLDESSDLDWSTRKQQELSNLVYSQTRSNEFELTSLTCKQMMCELIGVVYSQDAWREIYEAIINRSENVIPPWESDEELLVAVFDDEDKDYAYALFKFSK